MPEQPVLLARQDSHVIAAMGRGEAASQVIRISGGWQSSEADWTGVAKAVIEIYRATYKNPQTASKN